MFNTKKSISIALICFFLPAIAFAGVAPPETLTYLQSPPDITVEATGPLTSVSLGVPTYNGVGTTVSASPTGPFSIGKHTVIWTATDGTSTLTDPQYVTVRDTTPPVVTVPPNLRFNAEEASVPVDLGSASASDLVDGAVTPVTFSTTGPFPIGTHYVTWSATDSHGNTGTTKQRVIVTQYTEQDIDPLKLLEALKAAENGDETAILRFLLALPDIKESLDTDGINTLFREGELVLEIPTPEFRDNGCFGYYFAPSTLYVTLKKGATVSFNELNFNERLELTANLEFDVSGRFTGYTRDWCLFQSSASIDISGNIKTTNTAYANLASNLDENVVTLDVQSGFSGEITENNINVNLNTTLISIVWIIADAIINEEGTVGEKINEEYAKFVSNTDADVRTALDGMHKIVLPDIADELSTLVNVINAHPALVEYISEHRYEIMYYLLTAQKQTLDDVLTDVAACQLVNATRVRSMPFTPLYHLSGGACTASDPFGANEGQYYSDASCATAIAFTPMPLFDFCTESLASSMYPNVKLGNADWIADENQTGDVLPQIASRNWTMPIGATIPITVESLANNHVPYMKRYRFKTIDNVTNADGFVKGTGSCKLEMRVYKQDPLATNLKPILAFHGGSWQLRGGFAGQEAQVSHFTEKGFIVFAPFYRLAGENDGNPECNDFNNIAITEDAEDALTWVLQYGVQLGADVSQGVAVTGQSAGGHLAGWLVTHRPNDVSKGMLLYPPVDFLDYYAKAVPGGEYEDWIGRLSILTTYFNIDDPAQIPYDQMLENSFPLLVDPVNTPPVYIMQGTADSYVPTQNPVNLCNAYNGPDDVPAGTYGGDPSVGIYRMIYSCGTTGGQIHLFEGAGHVMDLLCIPGVVCPAGRPETANALAESLGLARDWLAQ